MKVTRLDVTVAVLAGLTVLTMKFNFDVWALFIGWAWYFALGAKVSIFKKAIPALFVGYILAGIAVLVYAAAGFNFYVLIAAVAVTVFLLMLSIKVPILSCSLASFNAYSCMFVGYYAGDFPKVKTAALDLNNIIIAILWIALANIVGILCGWISVSVGNAGSKVKQKA